MTKQIFVNLPVSDLKKSKEFYTSIGFVNNPEFTDETAAGFTVGENIYLMLLTHEKAKGFIKDKEVADATKSTEVLVAVSAESKEEVDEITEKAVEAGGTIHREPEDHGFMYGKSFEDLDGHIWEVVYMDMSQMEGDETK